MKKTHIVVSSLALSLVFGCSDNRETLYVYSWADYFSPELIQKFEEENDCRIDITTFDSNEAMYAKLKSGASGYDIITPTSYQVNSMVRDGMLEKLDLFKLPNVASNLDRTYDKLVYSPTLEYTVPYAITFCGIMYDKNKVDSEKVRSWSVFSDSKYKGRMSLLNDIREVIGIGLMVNGNDINTRDGEKISNAAKTVVGWKSNIRKFDSESYKTEVSNGSSYIGQAYSSDALQVICGDEGERDDIGFSFPEEGFTVSCDEFVIMKNSEKKELAYKFIDFLFETENCVENMDYICSLMPNTKAVSKIDAKKRVIMVPDDMSKGRVIRNFDDDQTTMDAYNVAWDEITGIEK